MFESQAGMIPFAKPVVSELLANMSKEEIASLAKNVAKNTVLDSMMVMRGKIDLNSFLSWFENLMEKASIDINHIVENSGSTHKYIVKHNLGENWAFLIENLLQTIFNDTLGIRINVINLSSTTLILQI
jgi:hypothetical protein